MTRQIAGIDPRTGHSHTANLLRHGVVTGPSGAGKSVYTLGVIAAALVRGTHVLVVDPKGELAELVLELATALVDDGRLGLHQVAALNAWASPRLPETLVPLNLLRDGAHLQPGVRASVLAARLSRFLGGEELGQRMAPCLKQTVRAATELNGSLATVLALLEQEDYARAAAHHLRGAARNYVATGLGKEPQQTRAALAARLRTALGLEPIRAMLDAEGCVSGTQLLEHRLSVLNLGGPPMGHAEVSAAVSSWLTSLVIAGLFARPTPSPHVIVVIDEAQQIARHAGEELSHALEQVRFKGANLLLMTQSLSQIKDAELKASLASNLAWMMALQPREAELSFLARHLPRPSGAVIDPRNPARLLSPTEERSLMLERLGRLPPGHGLFANFHEGTSRVLRSPDVPLKEIARRAQAAPAELRNAVQRGTLGSTQHELERRSAQVKVSPTGTVQPRPVFLGLVDE